MNVDYNPIPVVETTGYSYDVPSGLVLVFGFFFPVAKATGYSYIVPSGLFSS